MFSTQQIFHAVEFTFFLVAENTKLASSPILRQNERRLSRPPCRRPGPRAAPGVSSGMRGVVWEQFRGVGAGSRAKDRGAIFVSNFSRKSVSR